MNQSFTLNVYSAIKSSTLTLASNIPNYYVEFEGLDSPTAEILSSTLYNIPGSVYNGAHTAMRNIVLTVYLFTNVPYYRLQLHEYFRVGTTVKLTYEKTGITTYGTVHREIKGVVEYVQAPQFNAPERAREVVQISLLCPDPYLEGAQVSGTTGTVQYSGDVECGFQMTIPHLNSLTITAAHGLETDTLTIQNASYTSLLVDTQARTIKKVVSGTTSNAIDLWTHGSVWPRLKPGTNTVTVKSGTSSISQSLTYTPLYQGV